MTSDWLAPLPRRPGQVIGARIETAKDKIGGGVLAGRPGQVIGARIETHCPLPTPLPMCWSPRSGDRGAD